MKSFKAVLALALALILAFGTSVEALAESYKASVYVSVMNVYSKASASEKYKIGELKKGTSFTVTQTSGDWAKISYSGKKGYARIADMKSSEKKTMYIKSDCKMYKTASSGSSAVRSYTSGTKVYMVGKSGDYYLIQDENGNTGYIRKSNLSSSFPSFSGYAKEITPVYKTASSSTELFRVTVGARLKVTGKSGSYYKVTTSTGGYEGYIKTSAFAKNLPEYKKTAAYVNTTDAPALKKPSSGAEKWKNLSLNTKVYVVGESGSYSAVIQDGDVRVAYLKKSQLSASRVSEKATDSPKSSDSLVGKTAFAARITPMYEKASTSGFICSITVGAKLTVKSESGDYYRVVTATGSREGYVKKSDVSKTCPDYTKTLTYANKNDVAAYKTSSGGEKWGYLSVNTELYAVGEVNGYKAVFQKGDVRIAYVKKDCLSTVPVQATAQPTQTVKPTQTAKPEETQKPFSAKSGFAAKITTLYKTASTSSPQFDITVGTRLTATEESGSYYKVKTTTDGYEGYIAKSAFAESCPEYTKTKAYISAKDTPAYTRGTSSSARWQYLALNTEVYEVGKSGNYTAVILEGGVRVGYVSPRNLAANPIKSDEPNKDDAPDSKDKPSFVGTYHSATSTTDMPERLKSTQSTYSSSLTNAQKLEYVIYFAQERLGYPYSSHPNNNTSFDCLTLCYYAYSKIGKYIPSSSYACGYNGSYEYILDPKKLKRGDVVCFDTNPDDSDSSDHVGIYLGSGYFIHCSSAAKMVVVSNMNSGYYKQHFYVARRILDT